MERPVTIRFSHIDAANVVFYPRYFELLSELFAELPFDDVPFAMQTNFIKPNYLGDEILVGFEDSRLDKSVSEQETPGGEWSFTGRMGGTPHFSIQSLPYEKMPLNPAAHRPGLPAFQSAPIRIARWTTDASGYLQVSRFFELANLAVEQWFAESLGLTFRDLHADRRDGIPTVRMRTHCRELPRMGDTTTMWIRPTKIGGKSLTYTSWLVREDDCLLQNEQTIVFVELHGDHFKTMRIPRDLRERLEAQYVAA